MFPSVIPLYGTDCSRVTHPSAARISSVQALQISPLDLHVLSTPPAFVLSQDQTLMFDLSQEPLRCHQLAKAFRSLRSLRCLLSQNLTVLVASTLRLSAEKRSLFFLLCIVFKVRSPPSQAPFRGLPQGRSFQAAYAIIAMSKAVVKGFWQLFADFLCVKRIEGAISHIKWLEGVGICAGRSLWHAFCW